MGRYEVGIKLSPQGKGMEKKMVTHSSIFAWKIPWTEEPGGLQSKGSQRVRTTEQLNKKGKGKEEPKAETKQEKSLCLCLEREHRRTALSFCILGKTLNNIV